MRNTRLTFRRATDAIHVDHSRVDNCPGAAAPPQIHSEPSPAGDTRVS